MTRFTRPLAAAASLAAFLVFGPGLSSAALACDGEEDTAAAAEPAPPAGAATVSYTVEGMSCAGCSGKVRAALKKLPGVYTVSVDMSKKTAKVAYDPKKVTPEKIKEAISKTGFKPAVVA